ncbi:heavy-metal-associated domain-containing protein [Levilactobacillus acidifarinae]|uniref:HMA domain-containing protein n=1 Tax=Levilactobacillus acidifarinae DSM 19394 = JCM 15949 TaxID=1423715 RepID=A0A0R1LI86_9LACO|nr:heavy metal-associated domain-containing protein [Levilactobacillus acidifarinae]KRK95224.1 hypothetical protein FD25_GL001607 [Levilactobacillus acidifarinae DSM 19394]GEO70668.1 hypothetical protein LAC03_25780 [Levilactobacillus acidifarinae]
MQTVLVEGMKCSHCADHVHDRFSQKVTNVKVDLRHATATFEGTATLDELNATLVGSHYHAVAFL